jgi:hypothetical protein
MGLFDKVTDAIGGDDSSEKDQTDATEAGGVFDVPEWAVEDRVNVERRTSIIYEHYDVSKEQAQAIAKTLESEMESTEGYTQHEIVSTLEDELNLGYDLLETIIWTERASIEIMDTVNTYLEQNSPDDLYKLSAPSDDRIHPVTKEAANEIEEQGGVPIEELARILIEKAEKYEGGTPERMDHWVPHEKFRFSVVKHVDI